MRYATGNRRPALQCRESADHAINHIDIGIKREVMALRESGIETFESCQGGDGHAFLEPSVRFHGNRSEGPRAFAVALQSGLRPSELRRVWTVLDGELTGPCWELTFVPAIEMLTNEEELNGVRAGLEDVTNPTPSVQRSTVVMTNS